MTSIRAVVVDDQALIRGGIKALVERGSDIDIVGEAADGASALRVVKRLRPDVVLMDLVMPGMNGVEATRQIVHDGLGARVLVLTSFGSGDDVDSAMSAGASGYLLKDSEPRELLRAIRQVHHGQRPLHPAVAREKQREVHRPSAPSALSKLTARELDVLCLVAQGMSNQEIAEQLSLGETTVRTHVSNILEKLQLESRTQAALYAVREGLTSDSDARLSSRSQPATALWNCNRSGAFQMARRQLAN